MLERTSTTRMLFERFGEANFVAQPTADGLPTLWVRRSDLLNVLRYLKFEIDQPFRCLYDLTAIDERLRTHRQDQPDGDFTVVYHLLSYDRNEDIRLKVALDEHDLHMPSITGIWGAANWYECEAWDMFGIAFEGHPSLRRILMPPTWTGYPLRKDHPARATEMGIYQLPEAREEVEQQALLFDPKYWGMSTDNEGADFMFLNLGPNHPSVHGVFRIVVQLDGEEVVDCVPDIGYHHRAAEKMGERQSWHTYIPYTDRVDYLGGVMNNLPYVLTVEKLAGIRVPERAVVIRVMLCEFFRIMSHLLFFGTLAQDVGQMSPVFYMFADRERAYKVTSGITGERMHPNWFRIGGVVEDLPEGWEKLVREFLDYMPARLRLYDKIVLNDGLFRRRTKDVARYTLDEAIEWGVTGPGLRATGLNWDFRKQRPYSGYEHFDFEIPTAANGDSYDRCVVRVEEMRQSLRIIEQCLNNMPEGPVKAEHPLTTPPPKQRTLHDIETLITHFLNVSWGPVIPPGEASIGIEATKGN
ncbi:MAG TPA: NADH-quinone oxidoreductase subunit C/D, partial [Gammaproteobacteria bacterium]|nr:NADH-quinone oxidoreductase subunit C/D [Gammaproteobacteria bacterium]